MPIALPALIPILISAATAATGIGLELSNRPGSPNPNRPLSPLQQNQAVSQEQQARAVAAGQAGQQLPGLQESGSGGLNPGYLSQFSAINSGNGSLLGTGQLGEVVNRFLGLPGPEGTTAGSTGLALGSSTSSPAISSATSDFFSAPNKDTSPYGTLVYGQ